MFLIRYADLPTYSKTIISSGQKIKDFLVFISGRVRVAKFKLFLGDNGIKIIKKGTLVDFLLSCEYL